MVKTWEIGYKGGLNQRIFGTLDIYTSNYSSFVSPVTFITPIVVEKLVLETDYNGDGITNRIEDIVENNIDDRSDYDESFNHWRNYIEGVTAMDTIPGYTPPVVVGYINYGNINMWGFDASLTGLINLEWSLDLTYSYLGMTEFLNPITNALDAKRTLKVVLSILESAKLNSIIKIFLCISIIAIFIISAAVP